MGEGGITTDETAQRAAGVLGAFLDGLDAGRPKPAAPPGSEPEAPAAPSGAVLCDPAIGAAYLRACAARLDLCTEGPQGGDVDVKSVEFAFVSGVLMGLAVRSDPLQSQVAAVAARVPFTAAPVLAAAAGTAAAVSSGLDGASWAQRIALAAWAADDAAGRGTYRPGPSMSARLTWACALAERAETDPVQVIGLLVGNSEVPQECAPAAFALATASGDVEAARRAAGELGGQTDVIGALAGALVAAGAMEASAPAWIDTVEAACLQRLADELTARRAGV